MDGKKNGMATCEPAYKFQKAANITINGYLNFLTEYKKRYCGISPQVVIRFGAREWNKMSLQEKERFNHMKQPQVLKSMSHGDSPDKSEWLKRSPVRSPYSRERESRNKKKRKPSKSIKDQIKKKAGPPSLQPKKRGFIPFMRTFQRLNKDLPPNDMLKKATRIWCRLHKRHRKPF
nr:protamine-like protein 99C [Drosophila suzukii]